MAKLKSCYCPTCNRFVECGEGACIECGHELNTSSDGQFFVSGHYQRSNSALNIEPGTSLLDRFTILRRIGHGDGTAVYLAQDSVRSAEIALKVVEVGPCTSDQAAHQLLREMAVHERIADHRHVIRVYDMHFAPTGGSGLLLLAMEYADGGTLRQWLLERREDLQRRRTDGLRYFIEACCGVAAIHETSAAHLDLKPENLLFVNGVLKVSDFGVSLAAESIQTGMGSPWHGFPTCPGTAPYMSPEHFGAPHLDDLDARSDIYSLGAMLYEILHPRCRPPFGGPYERLRELHLHVPAPELPEADEFMVHAVARCLEKAPANRYPDVWSLLDDLECPSDTAELRCESDEGQDHDPVWAETLEHVSAQDYGRALTCCRQHLETHPGHLNARTLLEELQLKYEQADQIYRNIDSTLDRRSLTELVSLLREAVTLFPGHPVGRTTQANLAARAQTYRLCMEAGCRATQDGFWDAAITQFRQAQQLDPVGTGAAHALELVTNVQDTVTELRQRIDEAVRNHDRSGALALAKAADEHVDAIKQVICEAGLREGAEQRAIH